MSVPGDVTPDAGPVDTNQTPGTALHMSVSQVSGSSPDDIMARPNLEGPAVEPPPPAEAPGSSAEGSQNTAAEGTEGTNRPRRVVDLIRARLEAQDAGRRTGGRRRRQQGQATDAEGESIPEFQTVGDLFGNYNPPAEDRAILLPGYVRLDDHNRLVHRVEMNKDGSAQVVAHVPVYVAAVLSRATTGEGAHPHAIRLRYRDPATGAWRLATLPIEALADGRAFGKAILTAGVPADASRSGLLLGYLAQAYAIGTATADPGARLPVVTSVPRIGWHRVPVGGDVAKQVYVLPPEPGHVVGLPDTLAGSIVLAAYQQDANYLAAIRVAGPREAQSEAIRQVVHDWPRILPMLGASAASPMVGAASELGFLDIAGFTVDMASAHAGIGKSSTQALAAAIWGNPKALIKTWNSTRVGAELELATSGGLPVWREEVQAEGGSISTRPSGFVDGIRAVVMDVANGFGRTRGARDGGTRQTNQFNTLLIATGNASLLSLAAGDGAAARVLTTAPPQDRQTDQGAVVAARIRQLADNNYGHVGRALLERYVSVRNDAELMAATREEWGQAQAQAVSAMKLSPNYPKGNHDLAGRLERLSSRIALVAWGAKELALAVGLDEATAHEWRTETIAMLGEDQIRAGVESAVPVVQAAWEFTVNLVAANLRLIRNSPAWDTERPPAEPQGALLSISGVPVLAISETWWRRQLIDGQRGGLLPPVGSIDVLRDWVADGRVIMAGARPSRTVRLPKSFGGGVLRAICFDPSGFNLTADIDDVEEPEEPEEPEEEAAPAPQDPPEPDPF